MHKVQHNILHKRRHRTFTSSGKSQSNNQSPGTELTKEQGQCKYPLTFSRNFRVTEYQRVQYGACGEFFPLFCLFPVESQHLNDMGEIAVIDGAPVNLRKKMGLVRVSEERDLL
jgi:hypothetical protein